MSRTTWQWALLAALALLVRGAAIFILSGDVDGPQTYEHGEIARHLLAGRGFRVTFLGVDGPTSQQAPLVPWILTGCYALGGVDTPAALAWFGLLASLAGVGTTLAVVSLTRSLFPQRPRLPWIAGLIAALFPTHVYMATHVQAAPWATLLLTTTFALAARPTDARRRQALLVGLCGGLMLLVEPILVLTLPLAAWMMGPDEPAVSLPQRCLRQLGPMTLAACVTLSVIAPWLVRNRVVHGEWVFIKSTFGYAFWQGNHPRSWGTDKIPKPTDEALRTTHDGSLRGMHAALWAARHETLYIDDVLLKPAGYARFQGLSEPERSRLLGREAWGYLTADPWRYVGLSLGRLGYFLWIDPTNPKARSWPYRVTTAGAWLLLLVGLLQRDAWSRRGRPVLIACLVVTLFHALTIVSARFRIPLEALVMPWLALGAERIGATVARVARAVMSGRIDQ